MLVTDSARNFSDARSPQPGGVNSLCSTSYTRYAPWAPQQVRNRILVASGYARNRIVSADVTTKRDAEVWRRPRRLVGGIFCASPTYRPAQRRQSQQPRAPMRPTGAMRPTPLRRATLRARRFGDSGASEIAQIPPTSAPRHISRVARGASENSGKRGAVAPNFGRPSTAVS